MFTAEQGEDLKNMFGVSPSLLVYTEKFAVNNITKEILLSCDDSLLKETSNRLELKFGDYVALKVCVADCKQKNCTVVTQPTAELQDPIEISPTSSPKHQFKDSASSKFLKGKL